MKKTLFLAISMMVVSFAFSQQETFHELPNQDHTVFERGIGDTVYVLEEHVTYNLKTDQFGCTKKDSVVCKVLAGTLIVPPNYFQILKDSLKNKSSFCDCVQNKISYMYLWQNRGRSIELFKSRYLRVRTPETFLFSREDRYQSLLQDITPDGDVVVRSVYFSIISNTPGYAFWILSIFIYVCFFLGFWRYIRDVDWFDIKMDWFAIVCFGVFIGVLLLVIIWFVNDKEVVFVNDNSNHVWQGVSYPWLWVTTIVTGVLSAFVVLFVSLLVQFLKNLRQNE